MNLFTLLTHVLGIGARQVPFFTSLRPAAVAIVQSNMQLILFLRSYGTAKSGVGISATSVLRPDLMMKNVVPVVMAGIIAVSAYTILDRRPRF